jgi:MFS family permease
MSPAAPAKTVQAGAPEPAQPSPWRDRRFRIFATGNLINNLGEAVYAVALPLFVYERTGSLVVMSMVAALMPAVLLLSPVLGWLVDRYGPRVLVVPGLVLQLVAATALNLTGLAEDAPLWPLFVFGALVQVGGAAYRAGWMTGVAHMFPDNPVRSRGSLSSLYVISNVVGPLMVSALLLWVGYAALLWFNVLTFVAPIVVWLVGVHPPRRAKGGSGNVVKDLVEGCRVLRERPVILHAMLIFMPMLLVGTAGTLALSMFRMQDEFEMSARAVSLVLVAVRIAAVLGTVAVSERRTFPFRAIVLCGTVGMGVSLLLMSSGSAVVFVAAMIVMFGFQHALSVSRDMMVIRFLPLDALGRASGILNVLGGLPVLAAPLIVPPLALWLGHGPTFLAFGVFQLLGLLWLWRTWHQWAPKQEAPIQEAREQEATPSAPPEPSTRKG